MVTDSLGKQPILIMEAGVIVQMADFHRDKIKGFQCLEGFQFVST